MKIDMDKLRDAISTNIAELYMRTERIEAYNRRPYIDTSEVRNKRKNHSDIFTKLYDGLKDDLHSGDPQKIDTACLKLGKELADIAGRPLTVTETKNIISFCEGGRKSGRWSINAFGEMYITKDMRDDDWYTK